MPEGVLVDWRASLGGRPCQWKAAAVEVGGNEPGPFLLLAFQVHGHHPPGQILHALLVGQLALGATVQLPHLGAQRVLSLHLFRVIEVGAGGVVAQVRKDGVVQDILAGLAVLQ